MTNTKKVVFDKLFSKPANTKLSKTRKLKLSVVDEIESMKIYIEEATSEAFYVADELMPEMEEACFDIRNKVDNIIVNAQANGLSDDLPDFRKLVQSLEEKSGELGLDPSDIYDEYEEVKELLDNATRAAERWDGMEDEYPIVYRLTNLK